MIFWLALALTALMGVSLGLLGGGGSTLAVPILVHVLGLSAHSAIALSLVLVGSTALLAAGFHHRTTPLPFRESFLFAVCGAPFSIVGGVAARQIDGALLLLAFGLLMLVMGVLMFRPRPEATESARRHWPSIIAAGAAVGFLTGFLGVGGGFMIVPALVLLLHMPIKRAVGASLLVIALNCAVAIVGHWSSLEMNPGVILPLIAAALGGTFLGVELCKHFHPPNLRRAFAVFILVVGIFMVARSWPVSAASAEPQQKEATQFSTPLPTVSITGETLATISDGDFVHPAFSPDGKKLAYSGVIVENNTELTEIFIRNLESGKTTRLLDAKASEAYATYSSSVVGLSWKDNQTLTAEISDGDVDSTAVIFDAASGKILSEEEQYFDENDIRDTPLGKRALATFPDWPAEILMNALSHSARLSDDKYLIQKNYAGEDGHIWLLDFSHETITVFAEESQEPGRTLVSGFTFGPDVVFALHSGLRWNVSKEHPGDIHFLKAKQGQISSVARVTVTNPGWFKFLKSNDKEVLFVLQRYRSYEQGHNPLYVYDSSGLREIEIAGENKAELYDAAVSPDGKLLCLVLWQNNQRHLILKRLNLPLD